MKNKIKLFFGCLALIVFTSCGSKDETSLSVDAFQEQLAQHPEAVVLDVRTAEEVAEGVIPGAVNIDFKSSDFETRIDALDKSKSYYVYCAAGVRSEKAAAVMTAKGFEHVKTLAGGINSWKAQNKEITTQ